MRFSALKLFFAVLFLLVGFLTISANQIHAQTPSVSDNEVNATNPQATYAEQNAYSGIDPDVPINAQSGVQILLIETMSALACQLTGSDPSRPDAKCLGVNPQTGKIGYVENGGGLIAVMGKAIDMTFTPPITTGQYTAYLKNNFGLGEKVYAQNANANPCDKNRGIGFCGLQPILPLWIAMRNIVYLILILAFVIVGLGIMLRVHIDAHDVMTIQNQLPKIVMGIIAVTFSFAIAGLLIDVMFVATYLFANVIVTATGSAGTDIYHADTVISAPNPFIAMNEAVRGGTLNVAGQVSSAFAEIVKSIFTGPSTSFGNGDVVGNVIGGVIGTVVNILAFLIIAITIVVCLFRCWIALIVAYVNIILDIVFAPFWIIAGVMPGSKAGIGAWIKDMLANLAVYPVAVAFFLLAAYFIQSFNALTGADRFIPPLTGGVNSPAIGALIGIGFILMLPNVLQTTKQAFKSPGIQLGNMMGPLGVGLGAPGRAFSGIKNYALGTKHEQKGAHGAWEEMGKPKRLVKAFLGGGH